MMQGMQNIMRREAERVANHKASVRIGVVSGYDPNNYAAKVLIQPEGHETGFLPIHSPWTGNGWGMFCPPTPGDVVEVHFQEGGKQAPFVTLRQYGDQFRPLPVPSGEFWIVHKSGSVMKFHNDGTIEIDAATAINSSAPLWTHTGNVIVNGTIRATGDIWDNYLTTGYTMASFRARYDEHRHDDTYSGATSVPLAPDLL